MKIDKWLIILVIIFIVAIFKSFFNMAENGSVGITKLSEIMQLVKKIDKISPKPLKVNNNEKIMSGRYVIERYYDKSTFGEKEQAQIRSILIQNDWIGGGSLFCKDGIQLSIEDVGIYYNHISAIYYGFTSDTNGTRCKG